jgi:hypothetical protein
MLFLLLLLDFFHVFLGEGFLCLHDISWLTASSKVRNVVGQKSHFHSDLAVAAGTPAVIEEATASFVEETFMKSVYFVIIIRRRKHTAC